MQRNTLSLIVKMMFLALGLAFIYVLFSGVVGESNNTGSGMIVGIDEGQTVLRRVNGEPVWVTHISAMQSLVLGGFDDNTVMLGSGCNVMSEYCALGATTGMSGAELRFTSLAPAQLPSKTPWVGGFVNPTNGAVYDLFGRNYRDQHPKLKEQAAKLLVIQ